MKAVSTIIVLFAATAIAVPNHGGGGGGGGSGGGTVAVCDGVASDTQCCEVSVLGVLATTCENPPSVPKNKADFNQICASIGKTPQCCTLNLGVVGGLLCQRP